MLRVTFTACCRLACRQDTVAIAVPSASGVICLSQSTKHTSGSQPRVGTGSGSCPASADSNTQAAEQQQLRKAVRFHRMCCPPLRQEAPLWCLLHHIQCCCLLSGRAAASSAAYACNNTMVRWPAHLVTLPAGTVWHLGGLEGAITHPLRQCNSIQNRTQTVAGFTFLRFLASG